MGGINFIVNNYFPDPLSYSCPRLSVLFSSHIIDACRANPMAFFVDLTRPTVMVDIHAVSVGSALSYKVTDVFIVNPLGGCLPMYDYGCSGPLLFTAFACWSCWVKAATDAVRLEIVLHLTIMVFLSDAADVDRLMRASCVPSISLRLFALWYPPEQVETLCFLLNFRCSA